MLNSRMCYQRFSIFHNFVANTTLNLRSIMNILNVSFDMSIFLETFATHFTGKHFQSGFIVTNRNEATWVQHA